MAVSELNGYIKRQLQFDPILSQVSVIGEISNFKYHTSGHLYFTLKDEKSKIQCVMFQSHAQHLNYLPSEGEKTEISGSVSVYEKEGRYQIYVQEMKSVGKGELYKAFLNLKKTLELEGYFEKRRKIPQFPKTIGIVTSPTSAAVRDMITVLKRRNPFVDVIIYPVKVQGDQAKYEISKGLDYFNEHPVDTIIIGRGGGSIEELWAFNELMVAEAIFDSKIPVISGVGHETDFTIADFVSDFRAATPTEAAEVSVASIDQYQRHIENQKNALIRLIANKIMISKMQLETTDKHKLCQLIMNQMAAIKQGLLNRKDALLHVQNNIVNDHKNITEKLGLRLDAVSPLSTFARGYSVAQKHKTTIVSINDVEVSDSIDIILKNGIIRTKVISKERKQLLDEKK